MHDLPTTISLPEYLHMQTTWQSCTLHLNGRLFRAL